MQSVLIFLHGFNSSPLSTKALQLKRWCELNRPNIHFEAPSLPIFPNDVASLLENVVEKFAGHNIGLVGSSLGGYYATWLNQKYGFKTVLVNPAVAPYELLKNYLGEQQHPYTGETFVLKTHHMLELKALEVKTIKFPKNIWLLQQQGDEILNYKQALKKYCQCQQTVENKGNHAFVGFERFCHDIIQFLKI